MDNKIPPEKIFKSYDIRGIYPEEINEDFAVPIIKAIYKVVQEQLQTDKPLKFAVGRDMRLSSPAIFEAVSKTLISLGAQVIDLGIVSTPTFYYAVFKNQFDGGVQITASHNPGQYNGIKIVRICPTGLVKIGKSTGMDDIKKLAIEGVDMPEVDGGSMTKMEGVVVEEVENAIRIAGNPKLNAYKVVADAANALGALYIEELFKHIPGSLVKMNFELDGTFPAHQADPLQKETLVDLQKKVVEEGADVGLAPDGDGDRLFFIDEKGEIVPPSIITAIVARELLKKHKGATVLGDIRYIMTPKKIVEELGGTFVITKVGHSFITEKLHETGGVFAGESSSHYFFKETGNAESQIPMILIILKVMTEEGKKLSEIVESLRRSHESGEYNFEVKNAKEVMEAFKTEFPEGEVSELDGVSITFADWRLSLRSSNTEPLLRLNVEVELDGNVEEVRDKMIGLIKKHAVFAEGASH
ncbi:MAG: phosphomannomutase/phosphoglucomutase [Candidatus Daviesbacteria bacterium]|nr:phosphomannomutase/phosphoglucomutase [Candidatus Daviesbacteria bacterium]